jgi:hypothetical protein
MASPSAESAFSLGVESQMKHAHQFRPPGGSIRMPMGKCAAIRPLAFKKFMIGGTLRAKESVCASESVQRFVAIHRNFYRASHHH